MSCTSEQVSSSARQDENERRLDALLVGAIDLHCHSSPSVMPRSLDHVEAIKEASSAGMRAILLKDHYYSTTPISVLLNKHYYELNVTVLSGVPLNNTAGGINRYAVEHGLKLGARMIWMPTFSACNHIRQNHRHRALATSEEMLPPTALSVLDCQGRLTDEVKFILDQIAEKDAVLSGGHLHISEILILFEEAKKRGVNRRLLQHPTFIIGADIEDIVDITRAGGYVEHSICTFIEESRLKKFPKEELKILIDAVGVEQTILGSDLGQIRNPTPVSGFRSVIRSCMALGYSDPDIRKLVGGNAARLMGLD